MLHDVSIRLRLVKELTAVATAAPTTSDLLHVCVKWPIFQCFTDLS